MGMTKKRLESLRKLEGKILYLEAMLEFLPPSRCIEQIKLKQQLEEAKAERFTVRRWIEGIPNPKVHAAMALHYAAFTTWEETALYLGGISCHGVKKACERYLEAQQEKNAAGKDGQSE